ncbi:GDSL esterase/lipase At5g03610 [Linum grandiflorum]
MAATNKATFCFLLLLFSSLLLLLSVSGAAEAHGGRGQRHLFRFKPSKLFVFGDSYADTGNVRKAIANSWKLPYGITFPGKPAGRFSDGRVLTDFLAKFIGVKSPIPYKWRKFGPNSVKYGMNFAFGGTGVFDTLTPEPNMTTQIDLLQQMVSQKTYSAMDLHNSVALVSVAGNDYSTYLATNGSLEDLPTFITQVVNQTAKNLLRIQGMGIKKVVVTGLPPLGCLPATTTFNMFQQCNSSQNQLVTLHNLLLRQSIADLNPNNNNDTSFVLLDMFQAFMAVLDQKPAQTTTTSIWNPLKPCCEGMSAGEGCGTVDESTGGKRYTVCVDPKAAFFWDSVHPTQEGWRAVTFALKANLLSALMI